MVRAGRLAPYAPKVEDMICPHRRKGLLQMLSERATYPPTAPKLTNEIAIERGHDSPPQTLGQPVPTFDGPRCYAANVGSGGDQPWGVQCQVRKRAAQTERKRKKGLTC